MSVNTSEPRDLYRKVPGRTGPGSRFGRQTLCVSVAWGAVAAAVVLGAWAWPKTARLPPGAPAEAGSSARPAPHTPAPVKQTPRARSGYWIRLGPTRDLKTLSRTAGRLSERYGILGRVQTTWTVTGYRVVSGPVRMRRAAEERRRVLAASGLAADLREQPDGSYVLEFGVFQETTAAERVARAVRSRGYGTSVEPVRTPAYALTVGPLPERAVLAVARTLREAGAEFTVVSGR